MVAWLLRLAGHIKYISNGQQFEVHGNLDRVIWHGASLLVNTFLTLRVLYSKVPSKILFLLFHLCVSAVPHFFYSTINSKFIFGFMKDDQGHVSSPHNNKALSLPFCL